MDEGIDRYLGMSRVELLIRTAGCQPETFASAHEFLARPRSAVPWCLILDVSPPDLNGLELQERLAAERSNVPITFLSGHCEISMTVKAMKGGALELLTKPCDGDDEVLPNVIRHAIKRNEAALGSESGLLIQLPRSTHLRTRTKGTKGFGRCSRSP